MIVPDLGAFQEAPEGASDDAGIYGVFGGGVLIYGSGLEDLLGRAAIYGAGLVFGGRRPPKPSPPIDWGPRPSRSSSPGP